MLKLLICSIVNFVSVLNVVQCSAGDRSYVFQKCRGSCISDTCLPYSDAEYAAKQSFDLRLMQWTCREECDYSCMWQSVEAYQKDRTPIPQFYGKWPFIRVFGIQEPASVLFSLLNAIPHVYMMRKFRREVPKQAKMYYLWHIYAAVAIHAWFWSMVFHSRDRPFTEMMDYFGAIALNLFSVFILAYRMLGPRPFWRILLCFSAILAFFIYHVHYLAFVHFDYGYNMKAQVGAGLLMSLLWAYFCHTQRTTRPYVWKAFATVVAVNCLLALEVGDFAPWWWVIDAHSLWHLGTAPLGLLWYSFVIDDCQFNVRQASGDVEGEKKHN